MENPTKTAKRLLTIDELRKRGFIVPESKGEGFSLPLSGPLPDKPPVPETPPEAPQD